MSYFSSANNNSDPKEASASELDLFEPPSTFTAVQKIYYVDTRPTSQITTDSSPVKFNISGQGIDYIDLKRSKLHVKAKIVKADGTSLDKNEHVAPVNNWLHSLWSQIDVVLNDGINESDPVTGINSGLADLGAIAAESKLVDMEGPLYEDIMNSQRYLLNGVNLQIKLYPSSSRFNIMSDVSQGNYRVKVEDIYLRLCKIRPNTLLIASHAKTLESTAAKYPFTQSDIKVASIPKGQLSFTWDQLFQNKCPNKVIVALVSAEAMNGDYKKNPYNFERFALSAIALYVDGESLPSQPLHVSDMEYITAYNNLFEGRRTPQGLPIGREDFNRGYVIYQFCLESNPKKEGANQIDLIKRGNLRLDLHFAKALPETVNCLVYSEDNVLLEVDQARNILFNTA
ncbi:uncharacterized protein F54H12.2-like [Gigantopelta aegis]|uniref:uncharacterized protein F54H12.2-like n=1 Tax=Gigantopelta aegis TaxID=1735272 RepID=UPI001B889348|nr:uncharacterized protein F54H12.2-like [Gigantopelta aegis]